MPRTNVGKVRWLWPHIQKAEPAKPAEATPAEMSDPFQNIRAQREKNTSRAFLHCVIAGGQAMSDTFNGFHRIAETTEEKYIVVWLNEYFGPMVARRQAVRRI